MDTHLQSKINTILFRKRTGSFAVTKHMEEDTTRKERGISSIQKDAVHREVIQQLQQPKQSCVNDKHKKTHHTEI